MAAAAAKIWQEIVDDRPPDWFRPGSFELLEVFCNHMIEARRLKNVIAREEIRSRKYYDAQACAVKLSLAMATIASKLRLSVQSNVEWQSRKIAEHGSAASSRDPLLGGKAMDIGVMSSPH
jgi:hypothetical protein